MALHNLVDVLGAVLVQLQLVSGPLFCFSSAKNHSDQKGKKQTEDDDGDIDGAQHAELVRLLEEAIFALSRCITAY